MLARIRLFLLKTPVMIVLGMLAAYLLFCWFAFGPLAQWGAVKFIADKTGHRLTLDQPVFDPLRFSLTVRNLRLADPEGKPLAGFKELFIDFALSSLLRFAWTFDAVRLTGPEGRLALLPGGDLNWTAFIRAFKGKEEQKAEPAKTLPRLLISRFELKDGRLDFADQSVAPTFETAFKPLEVVLHELSTLPDDKGAYQISARTALGSQWRWKGEIGLSPVSVTGAFSLEGFGLAKLEPYLKGRVAIAAPEGRAGFSTRYRIGYDSRKLSLNLDQFGATIEGLRLRGTEAAEPALALERIVLSGGSFDLDRHTVSLAGIELAGGKVNLIRRSDGTLDVQNWFVGAAPGGQGKEDKATSTNSSMPRLQELAPKQPDSRREGDAVEVQPWQIELGRFSMDGVGIHVLDRTFARPLVLEIGNLKIGLKADARFGAGRVQVNVGEGGAALGKITFTSDVKTLLAMDGVTVEGVKVSLADKHAEVERLKLERGRLSAVRAADGSIALLEALKPAGKLVPTRTQAGKAAPDRTKAGEGPDWTWRLGQAELSDFQIALRDEKVKPVAALNLDAIGFSLTGLSQNLAAAVPVRLGLRVRQGGVLQVQGKLVPAKGTLDAQVNLSGLSLTPAQPYIGQAANVVLVSGKAGSRGRLKVADKVSYKGGFSVTDLLVNESETGNRLLAWKSLATDELTAAPEAVDIGEVKVDGLGLKLVIYKDKTLNLKRLMRPQPVPTAPSTPTATVTPVTETSHATPAAAASPPDKPGMRLSAERIMVSANELDFADESLALPFGARIHALKGVLNGIGRVAGQPAQLELDGQVDDYGLARAVGQIDLFNPTGYTDIKVVFRNVEMNRLSPYSATFAGHKIESGKLSLDLEYKIKNRQLQGDNQVIMDKLTLGERVESPTATNLPLDLAIAILEDSDGIIDLGLPVSGSLDDPQFSYGGIIWKAIVNVITKIATAPFRALGRLLGIGGEKLEDVVFDAGEARLLPPEREKIKQLAQALTKRPNLALTATPAWNPAADRLAVKESRMRRALAEAAGRTLAPDEDPGPVTTAQPKIREALEKLYTDRLGRDALTALKQKHAQANPAPLPTDPAGRLLSRLSGMIEGKKEPLSAEELSRLKGADLYGLIYRVLLDRETVTDDELIALAGARGKMIEQALQANGMQGDKLAMKPVERVTGEGREVAVKLELGVARKK